MVLNNQNLPDYITSSVGDLIVLETFAQLALLELARRCARDGVDELERVRQPELGELRGEESTKVGRRGVRARLEHHRRERTFRPLRMDDWDHRGFGHRRMAHQRAFERDRTDPLAAGLDQI